MYIYVYIYTYVCIYIYIIYIYISGYRAFGSRVAAGLGAGGPGPREGGPGPRGVAGLPWQDRGPLGDVRVFWWFPFRFSAVPGTPWLSLVVPSSVPEKPGEFPRASKCSKSIKSGGFSMSSHVIHGSSRGCPRGSTEFPGHPPSASQGAHREPAGSSGGLRGATGDPLPISLPFPWALQDFGRISSAHV